MEHKTGYNSRYVAKLGNPESITDDQHVYNFLGGLTEVKVNGVVYTEAKGFFAKPDATHYTRNKSAGEMTCSEVSFGNGTGDFEVVLTAEGYQTLTFQVENGELVK